jgi:hypothetical protein
MITVTSGANSENYPFAGQTVGSIRTALSGIAGIAPGAVATLNGRRVADDVFVNNGDTLVFAQALAQKG